MGKVLLSKAKICSKNRKNTDHYYYYAVTCAVKQINWSFGQIEFTQCSCQLCNVKKAWLLTYVEIL